MEYRCENCNKNFSSEESLRQHNSMKHTIEEKKSKINPKKYFIFISVVLIVILLSLSVFSYMKKPGKYDEFAKCLTEKGAVIYGNDYCSYTNSQMGYFGKSKKYLNYVKCSENQKLCDDKNIDITPTWEIKGEMYPQVQTFERLAVISGCEV